MTTNRQIVQTLRYMEWERAKGSLNAILASLWGWDISRSGCDDDVSFEELAEMTKEFIERFGEAAALD